MAYVETREHTGSYYAASRNDDTVYPRLNGAVSADVCVVGAGFSGLSTALHLAERGVDVILVEANRIGWGASGRNGGQVIGGYGQASPDKIGKMFGPEAEALTWKMGFECVEVLKGIVERYKIDCDLKWGYLDLAVKPRHIAALKEMAEDFARHGAPFEMQFVEKRDLHEYVGSDRYLAGLYTKGNGHVHPLNLALGEARAITALGGRIYEQSRVVSIERGKTVTVRCEEGSITADRLILCGNAYMGNLVPELASRVIPAGSYIIATEPLPDALWQKVLPKDEAVCDLNTALDYYRLSADRRLLFGGLANYSGRVPSSIEAALRPKMEKVFPYLSDIKVEYEWGGNMGIGLNRIPQLGRVEPNIFYVQAYSGHGVAPTHLSGKILADAVFGRSDEFDLFSKVVHPAFPGGPMFRQIGLALGMSFYKLRDMLY